MTTFGDLIEETRQHLMTGQPDRLNILDGAITDTADTLNLRHAAKAVEEGSTLVIDLEDMRVLSVSGGGTGATVTVIRGMNGSTKTAHSADALVYVNPQFSSFRIGQKINTALDNLSGEQLFQIKNKTLDANATRLSYDLASLDNFLDVWRVRHSTVGPSLQWPTLRPDQYWIDQAANTTEFASGYALHLTSPVPSDRKIEITYKATFNHLANIGDDVLTVSGLHTEAHDLPPLHAAISLLAGREVKRTFLTRQPEPRRQEEVPPGHMNQSMRPIIELYFTRLDTEINRLKRRYPRAY